MYPEFFSIGSFSISTYGVMNMLGYLLGLAYLMKHRHKINISKDHLWNIMFISILGAIIGGKIMYVIVSWPEIGATFVEKIKNLASTFRYGFVFFGGFIAVVTSLLIYFKKQKLPVLKTSDFLVVALPLGHAVGRIGCFLVGCCYGRVTDVPWAVHFTHDHALVPGHLHGVGLHPTQLYESAANLFIFLVLHYAYNRKHKDGSIVLLYAVFYGLLRFVIEFFRGDFRGGFLLGMSPSQLVSLGIIAVAGILYLILRKKNAK